MASRTGTFKFTLGPLTITCIDTARSGGGAKGMLVCWITEDGNTEGDGQTRLHHGPVRLHDEAEVLAFAQAVVSKGQARQPPLPADISAEKIASAITDAWVRSASGMGQQGPPAIELAAEDRITDDQHYAIMGGLLYRVHVNSEGQIIDRELLMNGAARITADIVATIDEGVWERYIEITIEVEGRKSICRLRAHETIGGGVAGRFMHAAGARLRIEPGAARYLYHATSGFGSPSERHVRGHTGWVTDSAGGQHYLDGQRDVLWVPTGDEDPPISVYLDPEEPVLRRYGMRLGLKPEQGWKTLQLFAASVPKDMLIPLLSIFILPIIHRYLDTNNRFMSWLLAPTGRLKTSLTAFLCCGYGDFFTEGDVMTWSSTPASWQVVSHILKDSLLGIEDYKHGVTNQKDAVQFIQDYSDSSGRQRRRGGLHSQHGFRARSIVMSSGEQTPVHEASIMARLIIIPVHDINEELFSKAQDKASYLSGITQDIIHWLAEQKQQALLAELPEKWRKLRAEYKSSITEGPNVLRIRGNIAQLVLAYDILGLYLEARGFLSGTWEEWHRTGEKELIALGQNQIEYAKQEAPHTVFLETLQLLLQGGRVALLQQVDGQWVYVPAGAQGPTVGWVSTEGIALESGGRRGGSLGPLAYHEVARYLQQEHQAVPTWATVREYLQDAGFIVRHDAGTGYSVKWLDGRARRIILLHPSALSLPKSE